MAHQAQSVVETRYFPDGGAALAALEFALDGDKRAAARHWFLTAQLRVLGRVVLPDCVRAACDTETAIARIRGHLEYLAKRHPDDVGSRLRKPPASSDWLAFVRREYFATLEASANECSEIFSPLFPNGVDAILATACAVHHFVVTIAFVDAVEAKVSDNDGTMEEIAVAKNAARLLPSDLRRKVETQYSQLARRAQAYDAAVRGAGRPRRVGKATHLLVWHLLGSRTKGWGCEEAARLLAEPATILLKRSRRIRAHALGVATNRAYEEFGLRENPMGIGFESGPFPGEREPRRVFLCTPGISCTPIPG